MHKGNQITHDSSQKQHTPINEYFWVRVGSSVGSVAVASSKKQVWQIRFGLNTGVALCAAI